MTKVNNLEKVDALFARYEKLGSDDSEDAEELKREFLQKIQEDPDLLKDSKFAKFLAQELEPEDISALEWDSPQKMARFSETLYHNRFDTEELATKLNQHASLLFSTALYQYEKDGEMEKMFRLLRLAPSYLLRQNEELGRLNYRANAYEVRRVRRSRRFLFGYLIIQVLLILFVFPFLFINAENGRLQNQVEEVADVEIGDEGYQLISYTEGVYWSIITASSIGYGDVIPTTTTGRIIAATLGSMGVITVGIVAGLILEWITPRRIN